jgi:hypothetical protein
VLLGSWTVRRIAASRFWTGRERRGRLVGGPFLRGMDDGVVGSWIGRSGQVAVRGRSDQSDNQRNACRNLQYIFSVSSQTCGSD